jgi:hypothetical protein
LPVAEAVKLKHPVVLNPAVIPVPNRLGVVNSSDAPPLVPFDVTGRQ